MVFCDHLHMSWCKQYCNSILFAEVIQIESTFWFYFSLLSCSELAWGVKQGVVFNIAVSADFCLLSEISPSPSCTSSKSGPEGWRTLQSRFWEPVRRRAEEEVSLCEQNSARAALDTGQGQWLYKITQVSCACPAKNPTWQIQTSCPIKM